MKYVETREHWKGSGRVRPKENMLDNLISCHGGTSAVIIDSRRHNIEDYGHTF